MLLVVGNFSYSEKQNLFKNVINMQKRARSIRKVLVVCIVVVAFLPLSAIPVRASGHHLIWGKADTHDWWGALPPGPADLDEDEPPGFWWHYCGVYNLYISLSTVTYLGTEYIKSWYAYGQAFPGYGYGYQELSFATKKYYRGRRIVAIKATATVKFYDIFDSSHYSTYEFSVTASASGYGSYKIKKIEHTFPTNTYWRHDEYGIPYGGYTDPGFIVSIFPFNPEPPK